jgi:ribosome-binding protein aMBF1 (putative translation factor)
MEACDESAPTSITKIPQQTALVNALQATGAKGGYMSFIREFTGYGSRPYPLDRERRRRVMVALAERDMTISGLARKIKISQAIVSKVINGRRLSEKTEQRIATSLENPPVFFFRTARLTRSERCGALSRRAPKPRGKENPHDRVR